MSIGTVIDFRSDFMEAEGILIKECQEPRVAFKLRNGALFKFQGDRNCLTGYHEGDVVLVFYDFGDYQDAQVMGILADLIFPLVALVLGFLFWKYGNWAKNYVPPTMRKENQN